MLHNIPSARYADASSLRPTSPHKQSCSLVDDGHEKLPRDGQIAARWRP
jgi:hypothetical protein